MTRLIFLKTQKMKKRNPIKISWIEMTSRSQLSWAAISSSPRSLHASKPSKFIALTWNSPRQSRVRLYDKPDFSHRTAPERRQKFPRTKFPHFWQNVKKNRSDRPGHRERQTPILCFQNLHSQWKIRRKVSARHNSALETLANKCKFHNLRMNRQLIRKGWANCRQCSQFKRRLLRTRQIRLELPTSTK